MRESSTAHGIQSVDAHTASLDPWPIPAAQIKDGNPEAAGRMLWQSPDKRLGNGVWSCGVGSFDWEYTWDETIYFLEGEVTIREHGGASTTYRGGELIFVPTGTKSTWTVSAPVRKVFHLRSATPVEL